jgi:hypothetical protein
MSLSVLEDIDVRAIREKISLSQEEFAKLFGLSNEPRNIGSMAGGFPAAPLAPS